MVKNGEKKVRPSRRRRFARISLNSETGESGFTLLELIITLLIISILAAGAVPVARNLSRKEKERQLKFTLREIRRAIDFYHRDCEQNKISLLDRKLNDACYPPTMETLVKGVPKAAPGGINTSGEVLRYLRRIPIDPMTGKDDWITESLAGEVDSNNVYDIHSRSYQLSVDGKTYYKDW